MAPSIQLSRRGDITDAKVGNTNIPVIAVVGFGVAGSILLFVIIWVSLSVYRKRAKKKREEARGAAFLTVKGVMKESVSSSGPLPADLLGINQMGIANGFSRANLTASVVLPAKAIYQPGASREEIISYHEEQGLMPRPFAPFSFALNAANGSNLSVSSTLQGSTAPSKGGSTLGGSSDSFKGEGRRSIDKRVSTQSFSASAARLQPAHNRNSSMFSALRDSIRDSFFGLGAPNRPGSAMSSMSGSSSLLSAGGVQTRRVHQIFTPILPDEPTLVIGERVAVLRSFDDGWCVIGRDKLFGQPGDVELGTVPAWCFVKPMKGLKSERPVRSSSLGVTVQVDLDGPQKPRDDIISWSNF